MVARAGEIAAWVARGFTALQHLLVLVLRLHWGYQFYLTGSGKLANIGRTAGFFAKLGIPLPTLNAYMAGATECFGGLLLLAGLLARPTSVMLAGTMVVAYGTAHSDELGAILSEPDKFTSAAPFLFLLVSLLVLAFGPGVVSLDALLAWLLKDRIRHPALVDLWLGWCAPLVTGERPAGGAAKGAGGGGGGAGGGGGSGGAGGEKGAAG